MQELLIEYWPVVALIAAFLAKLVNKITPHFSESKAKWLLVLVDLLDVLKLTPPPAPKDGVR